MTINEMKHGLKTPQKTKLNALVYAARPIRLPMRNSDEKSVNVLGLKLMTNYDSGVQVETVTPDTLMNKVIPRKAVDAIIKAH